MHTNTETCMNAIILVFVISNSHIPIIHYSGDKEDNKPSSAVALH